MGEGGHQISALKIVGVISVFFLPLHIFLREHFPDLLMLFNERGALLISRMYLYPQIAKALGTYIIVEYSCLLNLPLDGNSSLSSNNIFSILLNEGFL